MYIAITSNLKKYYKGYIDFIDHYWLNFFENQKIEYSLIPNWDFFRYDVLPAELKDYRVTIERMLIHQFASIMKNTKNIRTLETQTYRLVNEKIDKQ